MEADAATHDLTRRLGLLGLDHTAEHVHNGHCAVATAATQTEKPGCERGAPSANEIHAITALYKIAHSNAHDEVRRAENTMLNCEPEDVLYAKNTYKAALRRAEGADGGAPPPSPPPSPPDSPPRGPTQPHTRLGAPHATRPPEGLLSPPSPPPSPPQPLEERLELLATAEDAVARHYTFPSEPENFTVDVLPYLVRLVISFGVRPMAANTRAVFAVLVRSDDKNDSPSDLFVYSLMLVPSTSFVRWKAIIDTLRADGGYGATSALLSLAEGPDASAPPSPAHSDDDDDLYCALTDPSSYDIPIDLLHELEHGARYVDDAFELIAVSDGPLTPFGAHAGPPHLDLTEHMATLDIDSPDSPPSRAPNRHRAEAPPTPRRAATPHPKRAGRAPIEPALGARRNQIAHRRTRKVGRAIWLATRTLRRPLVSAALPAPTPNSAGAGCSTDPFPPEVDPYGFEVIQYSARANSSAANGQARPSAHADGAWNGLAVPCATVIDCTGGTGLAYTGDKLLKRGDLIGVFLADTMVTTGELATWLIADPLHGEYAWCVCGWALIDSKERSLVSKVNEGARPNTEMVEVDVGQPGDTPTYTIMALYALEDIHSGDTLLTDYGTQYFRVRGARRYTRPFDPNSLEAARTRWLNLSSPEPEVVLLNTLSADQLLDAKTWGGVLSYGGAAGGRNDPNRRRGRRPAIRRLTPPIRRPAPSTAPAGRGAGLDHRRALAKVHAQLLARATDTALWSGLWSGQASDWSGQASFAREARAPAAGPVLSAHSLRVMGATALLAAGADPIHIRAMTEPVLDPEHGVAPARPDRPAQRAAAHSRARLHWAGAGPAPPGVGTVYLQDGYNGFCMSGAAPLQPGEPCTLAIGLPAARKADVATPTDHLGGQFWVHVTNAQCHNDGLTHARSVSIHTCDPLYTVCDHRRSSPDGTITARLIWPHGQLLADNPPKMAFDCPRCGYADSATPLSDGDIITFGAPAAKAHPAAPRPPDQGAARVTWRLRLEVAPAEPHTTIRLNGARSARIRAMWHRRRQGAVAKGESMQLGTTTTMTMHSMLHYEPWQHHRHHGARPPATVSLCVELPDGNSGKVHISAALDRPLAEILANDGLGIRLLLDGERLDDSRTPRALGLHDDGDSPTLQLLFEQTGGGDGNPNHDDTHERALFQARPAHERARENWLTRRACDWGGRLVTNLGHCADDRRFDHQLDCVMIDDAITQCCCHMVCYRTVAENELLCEFCTDDVSHACTCAGTDADKPGEPGRCCTREGEEGYVSTDDSLTAEDLEPPDASRAAEPDVDVERSEAELSGREPLEWRICGEAVGDQHTWHPHGVTFRFENKEDPFGAVLAPSPSSALALLRGVHARHIAHDGAAGAPTSTTTDPVPPEVDPYGLEVIQYSRRAPTTSAATRLSGAGATAPTPGRRRGRRGGPTHTARPQSEPPHAGAANATDPAASTERLAARLATIRMARLRTRTSYATAFDESDACTQNRDIESMTRRLDRATNGGAAAAVAAKLDALRLSYTANAWEDLNRQARRAPGGSTRRECAVCGAHCTVPTPPRTLGGCLCGGGVCTACAADTCACPWSGGAPAPPTPDAASMRRNAIPLGYLELPGGDPYAPTILCMGDASEAMAKACVARFPTEICLVVDFRTRRAAQRPGAAPPFGLYWCGDVRDVLWRQRWRLVIGHPDCADAALSNKTGKQARVDSGQLWWSLAFAVRLYCAPADVVLIEQPDSILAKAYREPDLVMQYLDHGVGFSKRWNIWRRGGEGSFNPATPTTPGAAARTLATHRQRHRDRDEQGRIRSVTPPQMAAALCATVNLNRGAFGHQPRYEEEVEVLAANYSRVTGQAPPDGYAEATAQPPDPHAHSAPGARASANAPPTSTRHPLADMPLPSDGVPKPTRRLTPDSRAAASDSSVLASWRLSRAAPTQHARGATHDAPSGSGAATPTDLRAPPCDTPPSQEGGDTR